MGKQVHEKVAVIAVSDEAANRIAADHGLEAGDWIRVNNERDYLESGANIVGARREMAFDNDELADQDCRFVIDRLSIAGWTNHQKPQAA
jgi:hypothetical protein